MSLLRTLGQVAADLKDKAHIAVTPERIREDVGLPMGAHIGALVNISESALDRSLLFGSLIIPPKTGEGKICSISRVKMGEPSDYRIFSYYLANGDRDEGERFLKVVEHNGIVVERYYHSSWYRLLPGVDQVRYYRGDKDLDDRIGGPAWEFDVEWLRSVLPKEVASNLPTKEEKIVWLRESPGDQMVQPTECSEDRVDDPHGDKGHKQKMFQMSYVRQLEGGQSSELLVITLEMSKDQVHVDFTFGIPLADADVQVIPTKV